MIFEQATFPFLVKKIPDFILFWKEPRAQQPSAPLASLKKQTKTLFRAICYERKTLFRPKKIS